MDERPPSSFVLKKQFLKPSKGLLLFALAAIILGLLGLAAVLFSRSTKGPTSDQSTATTTATSSASSSSDTSDSDLPSESRPTIYISGEKSNYSDGGLISLSSTDEPSVKISSYKLDGLAKVSLYEANQETLLHYLIHNKEGKQTNKTVDTTALRHVNDQDYTVSSQSGKAPNLLLPLTDQGIWILKVSLNETTVYSVIVRSQFGVLAKEADNEHIFWGQSFKTRKSISEGSIKLFSLKDGVKELASTTFGTDGIAKSPLSADIDIAIAQIGDDRAVVPINMEYFDSSTGYTDFVAKTRSTNYYLFTDRPIYKPGDKISFKSVLRDDDDARYTIPTGQATITLSKGYENKTVLFEKSYPISKSGTVNGDYTLPTTMETGYYNLTVKAGDSTSQHSISIQVEHYRKPEYSIEVTADKNELKDGEVVTFTIKADYFSGQPVANQSVNYRVTSDKYYDQQYLTDRQPHYTDYPYSRSYGSEFSEGSVTLDVNGQITVPITATMKEYIGQNHILTMEATLVDGSANSVFDSKSVFVDAGDFNIYRTESTSGVLVGKSVELPVQLTPHTTESVKDIKLTAKVHRENWVPYEVAGQKYPSYRKEEEDQVSVSATTDAEGKAKLNFTPKKVGSYTLTVEAKDSDGRLVSKEFYIYVSSQDSGVYRSSIDNQLTIEADKALYQPTDTAHLAINSLRGDEDLLLTVERDRVSRFQIVHLSGKSTTVDLPLSAADLPNTHAVVTSFSDTGLFSGTAKINLSLQSKQLNISLVPDKARYGPGETVNLNIEAKDGEDKPVVADLAVWAVDKAIFELTESYSINIFDQFWRERYNNTATTHSLKGINVDRTEMGGGGGDDRTVFKDTAYWNPTVTTDASGKAKLSFKLPDNLTTWTIAAVGATNDTRVGQRTTEVTVAKNTVIRPLLPNILREGDEINLGAYLHNFNEQQIEYTTELTFDAGAVTPLAGSKVIVAAKDKTLLSWKLLVQSVKEKASLVFSASDGGSQGDKVTQTVPVKRFGFSEKDVQTAEGTKSLTLKLPKGADADQSKISIKLAPSIIGTLPSSLNYLVSYPYGCAEQTSSQLAATLLALANQAEYGAALNGKDGKDLVEKQIAHLKDLRRPSGGWPWWYSGQSNLFISAYIVEQLMAAKQAGYTVDDSFIADVRTYFEDLESNKLNNGEKVLQKYGLSLLNSSKDLQKLEDLDKLSPDLLALAVMANYRTGDQNPETNGLSALVKMAQTQGDAVFWNSGSKIQFGSTDASTALAIKAILMTGGDKELATKAIRYLARNRQYDYWSNTFATAHVSQALALYAQRSQELTPNYTYSVALDGKEITQVAVTSPQQKLADLTINPKDLKVEGSNLTITKNGTGDLYSTATVDAFLTDRKAAEKESGLSITREYDGPKGYGTPLQAGDEVTVYLTVGGLKADENYAVIVDELPAGMVPINENLNNEQYGRDTSESGTNRGYTENGVIISIYELKAGTYSYSYRARVVSEGRFIAPPATVSLMYAPEISGRTAVEEVIIDGKTNMAIDRHRVITDKEISEISDAEAILIIALLVLALSFVLAIILIPIIALLNRRDRAKNALLWKKE